MTAEGRTLDEIMSERETAPEQIEQGNTTATESTTEGMVRDEHGRFAPKAGEPIGETVEEPAEPENVTEPEKGKVPQQALHESRQRERSERDRADNLERQIAQLTGQMQVLMQMQQPRQPNEPAKPKDFWEDPNAFVSQALSPVQQQVEMRHEQMSRMFAEDKHGADTVSGAYEALKQAAQTDPQSTRADYQRIMSSGHPYGELVAWHQRRQAMSDIGEDPAAYRERVRAELMAEMAAQQTTAQQPGNRQPMPSNFARSRNEGSRAGTTYSGPKPLSEIMER